KPADLDHGTPVCSAAGTDPYPSRLDEQGAQQPQYRRHRAGQRIRSGRVAGDQQSDVVAVPGELDRGATGQLPAVAYSQRSRVADLLHALGVQLVHRLGVAAVQSEVADKALEHHHGVARVRELRDEVAVVVGGR